ncbi:MAG: response regulator [Planctomycetota bacterium]|jgi:PAS domain S-box-containing protein
MSSFFSFSTIRAKFIVPVSLTMLVLFALLEAAFIYYQDDQAEKKLKHDIEMITDLEAELLSVAVWDYNENHIKEIARYAFHSREVVYIKVYEDKEGQKNLAHFCRDDEWKIKKCIQAEEGYDSDPYLIKNKKPITRNVDGKELVIGLLDIGFTSKFYQEEKVPAALLIMLFGVLLLVIIIGLLTIIANIILGPVHKLTEIVTAYHGVSEEDFLPTVIASGRQLEQAEKYSKDETGQLALAFNVMMNRLRDSLEKLSREIIEREHAEGMLQTAYDQQELQIQARTAKLAEANKNLEVEINERKQTENALRESEERYRGLFSNIGAGVVVHAPDASIIYSNQQASDIIGLTDEQMRGREVIDPHWQFIYADGSSVELGEYPVNQVIKSGKPLNNMLLGIVRPQQSDHVWVLVNGFPVLDAEGNLKEVIINFVDITERQQMEEQLRQSEKMQAIGQLAGGIAHDFNNQLTVILGYAEILTNKLEDETMREFASYIVSTADHATELTRQLLAFSRKGNNLTMHIDIHDVLREVSSILEHSIDKRIKIKTRFAASPATTFGDPNQLQNAFLNIALNARDAMPEGGELLFETEMVRFDSFYINSQSCEINPGDYLLINIADTGCGIDKKNLGHVFEPFFTTKEVGEGTGMGLASVYGTVTSHNGAVDVESEPGHGTVFKIYLPSVKNTPRRKDTDIVSAPAKGTAKILLIDDEKMVQDLTVKMLEELGYKVTLCCDGREGVEYYKTSWRHFDLVILDMVMPELGGRETFRAMRNINPDIKAILSTGYNINVEAQAILDEGVMGFIAKPFKLADLSEKIEQVLRGESDG